jgi:hypothetical protein
MIEERAEGVLGRFDFFSVVFFSVVFRPPAKVSLPVSDFQVNPVLPAAK